MKKKSGKRTNFLVSKRKHRRRLSVAGNNDCNRPKYLYGHLVIRAIDFSKVPGARFSRHESHDSYSCTHFSSSLSLASLPRYLPSISSSHPFLYAFRSSSNYGLKISRIPEFPFDLVSQRRSKSTANTKSCNKFLETFLRIVVSFRFPLRLQLLTKARHVTVITDLAYALKDVVLRQRSRKRI